LVQTSHQLTHVVGVATFRPLNLVCTKHNSFWVLHTHSLNGPLSRTTRVSLCQKAKTNLDFTEARDSEWQWHQLGRMQVCTLLPTDNHASTPPLSFIQAGCSSCHPTNSVKTLKAVLTLGTNTTKTNNNCKELHTAYVSLAL